MCQDRLGTNIQLSEKNNDICANLCGAVRCVGTFLSKGMQQAPEDPEHIMAGACCKHYVANSMEGTTQADGEHHDRGHVGENGLVSLFSVVLFFALKMNRFTRTGPEQT